MAIVLIAQVGVKFWDKYLLRLQWQNYTQLCLVHLFTILTTTREIYP